ncbi:MAG: hypothetical protein ACK6DW_10170 [Betaproteobacteria bacterium]
MGRHPLRNLELAGVDAGGRRHPLRAARDGQDGKHQNGPGPSGTRSGTAGK